MNLTQFPKEQGPSITCLITVSPSWWLNWSLWTNRGNPPPPIQRWWYPIWGGKKTPQQLLTQLAPCSTFNYRAIRHWASCNIEQFLDHKGECSVLSHNLIFIGYDQQRKHRNRALVWLACPAARASSAVVSAKLSAFMDEFRGEMQSMEE